MAYYFLAILYISVVFNLWIGKKMKKCSGDEGVGYFVMMILVDGFLFLLTIIGLVIYFFLR